MHTLSKCPHSFYEISQEHMSYQINCTERTEMTIDSSFNSIYQNHSLKSNTINHALLINLDLSSSTVGIIQLSPIIILFSSVELEKFLNFYLPTITILLDQLFCLFSGSIMFLSTIFSKVCFDL